MPKFDATGPQGAGPGTGRGMGPCGAGNAWRGRGQGWGRGAGATPCGRWPWWIQKSADKEEILKDLELEKADIEKAIEELKENK